MLWNLLMNAINNMSEDIVTTAKTVEILLKLEKEEDRKIICAYKMNICLMKHDQPCFFTHNPSELRRKPFDQGKLVYINKMCEAIKRGRECAKKEICEYCHSEMELLYHPCEYKTKMCDKQSHPTPNYCCFAHSEGEIRDITGYKSLLPKEPEEAKDLPDDTSDASSDSNKQVVENVAELPLRLESEESKGKMKKCVSLICSGDGGIEEAFKSIKKTKNNNRKKKNKNRSKQGTEKGSLETILFLDLNSFKVKQCTAGTNHNPKKCLNYHDFKRDRRRPMGTYSSEFCLSMTKIGECPNGDACNRAHNRVEEFYHPEKYKVKFCSTYPNEVNSCEYGNFCSFAHHVDEIMIDLLDEMDKDDDFYMYHFKTVWCPYTEKKHARDECVYAKIFL